MRFSRGGEFMEELLIISGLVGAQIFFAVYTLFLDRILAAGVNSMFLVIFGSMASAFFLLPFAVGLERQKWPRRLRLALIVQMLLIATGGTAYQALMLLGIKKTSPAIASAMPNLAPGIIFVIAACVRFEKFSIWCKYSRAKILGTIICLSGAITMSFLMSPSAVSKLTTSQESSSSTDLLGKTIPREWILGCFYLLAGVVFLSFTTVLQAAAMLNFPAPFSLCVIASMTASIITALLQIIMEGKLDVGSSSLSFTSIIAIVLMGAVMTSVCVAYQTWCVKKMGPVMVSIFSPIQTVFSAVLSAVILGQVISLGSLAGMLLMFVGLYVVLWAKKKEGCHIQDADDNVTRLVHDIEKPLLA